jgi:hypothetical protein
MWVIDLRFALNSTPGWLESNTEEDLEGDEASAAEAKAHPLGLRVTTLELS